MVPNPERTWVLLHGSPGDATTWEPLRAHAPIGASLEAWDLLDHGRVRHAPSATLDDVVADVVARVEALGRPVTLVGHSFELGRGARVRDARRARAAIRVSRRARRYRGGDRDALDGLRRSARAGRLSLAAAADAGVDLWLPRVGRNADDAARIRTMITGDRLERVVRVLRRQCGLADQSQRVRSLNVPTVGVGCRDDRGTPLALGRELAELAPTPTFVELDGDSHFPHWTHTAQVAAPIFA